MRGNTGVFTGLFVATDAVATENVETNEPVRKITPRWKKVKTYSLITWLAF
jgi:hypothetical protein